MAVKRSGRNHSAGWRQCAEIEMPPPANSSPSDVILVDEHRSGVRARHCVMLLVLLRSLFGLGRCELPEASLGSCIGRWPYSRLFLGQLARLVGDKRPDISIQGIHVQLRKDAAIPVEKSDGTSIPYGEGSFDVMMFFDVLHHTNAPNVRSGRRVTCVATLVLAAGTAASGEKISARLQPLALNLHSRWRCDSALFTGSIRDRFNHPLPAEVAILVVGPSCATAFPDLHSPVGAVGRNRERVCECGRRHYSAQHSNQKDAHHFSIPQDPLYHGPFP